MRYGKKISAILAATMLISSTSAFAAVPDIAAEEVKHNETEIASLAAEALTVTVEQTSNGTVAISNNSLANEITANIPSGVTAESVVSDNDYFRLIAPTDVVIKTDKSGVFADNPEISTDCVEFRLSGPAKIFIYEAKLSGVITAYARFNDHKSIELADASDATKVQTKYLGSDTAEAGTTEDNVYGTVTFNVEADKSYQLYARGGTGRLFGIKFVGANDSVTTESLTANAGDTISVVATPNEGYVVSKILVDGKEVTNTSEYSFQVSADAKISAEFVRDPVIADAEKQFNDLTIPGEVTENLTLPTELAGGLITIAWESSDPAAIGVDGKVNRVVGTDVPVTLTAVATINGTDTATRTFAVTVKGIDIATEFEAAVFELPETITEDFKVPATFLENKIVWSVDETRYITFGKEVDADGNITATVTKPYYVEGDKAVVITAQIEGIDSKKTFNATVLKNENSDEASTAQFVAERIEIEGEEGSTDSKIIVDSDIDLPATDDTYGGKITWKSSNPKVISTTGEVTRKSKDTTVYLTAIVELDGLKASREFKIVVEGTGSSSGGGGGGYSSGFAPSTGAGGVVASYADYSDIVANSNINTNVATPNVNANVAAPKFTDLGDYAWAVSHIEKLVNKNIVNGVGDNKFDPSGLVTREQFATMLVRAFGYTGDTTNAKNFEDVDSNAYYAEAVAILSSMGVIKGQTETTFGVGQSITRQDMAVMCALATGIDSDEEATAFGDAADISEYAVDSVTKMQKCGVLAGDENGNFNPNANATRAEAAKVISALMDAMDK